MQFIVKQIVDLCEVKMLRWPGIEPGSTAWKAAMLTIIPPTHYTKSKKYLTNNPKGVSIKITKI